MENPIYADRNPNPIACNQICSPAESADAQDRKLQHLFSAVQNLAASRDSSFGGQHNPLCVNPPTSLKSGRRPIQTDFFREVSLFNAHFGSEPERSRWAQFLPDYLRPGNLENYLKQTKKPKLFGNNFWWTSQESTEQDYNSRLATVNQKKTSPVPVGQKDLQSSEPCSRRIDHIQYSRDQLLQLRGEKTVSEAIMKIKQGIEVEFSGVKRTIEHRATVVDNNGTKKENGLTSKEKREEKKVANFNVNAKKELKTGEKAELEEGIPKKRKRGMSDERKAKKKMKERKKRAENNRKLGVKRLTILPIMKPKPVSHCRHYIHGRCYEGEACKFSHDIVPLTKSKPCSHFARQACMKGDDCPFDHELSKYPCNNYVSIGSCNRGESCFFSHEITPKQDSGSAIGIIKPGTKSLNPSPNFGSTQQIKKSFASESSPLKGLNFPVGASAKHKQTNLSEKSHFAFEAGAPTSTTKNSSAQPYTVESIKDNILTSKVNRPVKTPKGLTFLNTGNLQKNDSARDEQTPQKTSNGVEAGVLPNEVMVNNVAKIGEKKQLNFPIFGKNSLVASAGDKKDSGDSNQPVKTPKGLTFLHTGNLQKNDSARDEQTPQKASNGVEAGVLSNEVTVNNVAKFGEKKQLNLPTFGNNSLVASAGDKKDSGDSNQKPNIVPLFKFPASTSSSTPFLTRLENSQVKNPSTSGQRSLLSTLGFASKYGSGGTRNSLIGTSALTEEVNKSTGTDHSGGTQQTESLIKAIPNVGSSSSSETSGKRSLLSTLGFASKYDNGGMRNSLIGTSALTKEVNKSRGTDHSGRTQQTESPTKVIPSVGSSSSSGTVEKKPANPLEEMLGLLYGGGGNSK